MPLPDYYNRINPALLKLIPADAGMILEVGCGAGALAKRYRQINPSGCYLGIELNPEAAEVAQRHMDRVCVGNVESLDLAEFGLEPGTIDCLIYGDVLEHLVDPWRTLKYHTTYLAPGGIVLACIPNVQHWSLICKQFRGLWLYEDEGLLDRTHLRFFSLETIKDMFAQAALFLIDVWPRNFPGKDFQAFQQLCKPLLQALNIESARFAEQSMALQYIIRATNKMPSLTD